MNTFLLCFYHIDGCLSFFRSQDTKYAILIDILSSVALLLHTKFGNSNEIHTKYNDDNNAHILSHIYEQSHIVLSYTLFIAAFIIRLRASFFCCTFISYTNTWHA